MTRAEHLAWCKKRAMAYLIEGDLSQALASFVSDMDKHEETAKTINSPAAVFLKAVALQHVLAGDDREMHYWIEGWN